MDYYLLSVTRDTEKVTAANGRLKKGYARVKFLDVRTDGRPDTETFDLRGLSRHTTKFQNWVKREFGYLRHEVEIGR